MKRRVEVEDVEDVLLQQLDGNLPSDVLLNILLRLPLESLSHFRWVCTSWYNFISHSRYFAKDCTAFDNEKYVFLGCVNGLACFSLLTRDGVERSYYICNPITRDHVIYPAATSQQPALQHLPTYYHHHSGFGYDPDTDTYKVIRIHYSYESLLSKAEVCTLGSRSWRSIDDVPSFRPYKSNYGVFVSGSLHWSAYEQHRMVIVSFNMSTEKFGIIPFPPSKDNLSKCRGV
ncbi:hypothetical protein AQUCO_01800094v1 [Aquilegia coerulea]|uniref:F-box domain-containing protein n=1 Tax=Aquilegia coerulea TaxID=218851 RepID=A0A2G5DJV7_AQUCA|nr:hypothetical protein AQUCO_01800094v1 [Aquilegia coerulea]